MKARYTPLVLAMCLAPVLFACGNGDENGQNGDGSAGPVEQPAAPVEEVAVPTNDSVEAVAIDRFYRFIESRPADSTDINLKGYVGHEYREVLVNEGDTEMPATSFASELLILPDAPQLDFGVAIDVHDLAAAAPVAFEVAVIAGGDRQRVFEKTLAPGQFADEGQGSWLNIGLDLRSWAGQNVRIVFAASPATEAAQAMWGDPILHDTRANGTDQPNVILISLDTLRADHLGAYGYERDTSPNLDAFFKEGYLFENCIASSSWTTPSHATVFTGVPPALHGAGGLNGHRLRNAFPTLAELMRNDGYLTAAFTEGAAVGGQLGFYQGYNVYSNGPATRPAPPGEADKTFEKGVAWLEKFGHLPFSLFMHTYEIHWPFLAPGKYTNKFTEEPVDGPEYLKRADEGIMTLSSDPEVQKVLVDLYDGGVAYTDAVMGEFFRHLDRMGLLENSYVVIFSDHGEAFWEHGIATHGTSLYREMLHVPLFIRPPGGLERGVRISERVALEDIFPTLMEYLEYDYEAPGRAVSLTPLTDEEKKTQYARDRVMSHLYQFGLRWFFMTIETSAGKYIVTTQLNSEESPMSYIDEADPLYVPLSGETKLIKFLQEGGRDWWTVEGEARQKMLQAAREEVFRFPEDVEEKVDLSLQDIELLRELRAEMYDEIQKLRAYTEEVTPTEETTPLSEEEVKELEALGYILE